MRVPWSHIVQLMPSILEVSKELLRRTRPPVEAEPPVSNLPAGSSEMEGRVRLLEDNEQRQAMLSRNMADQLAQLTAAVTLLHRQVRWLTIALGGTALLALCALVLALR